MLIGIGSRGFFPTCSCMSTGREQRCRSRIVSHQQHQIDELVRPEERLRLAKVSDVTL